MGVTKLIGPCDKQQKESVFTVKYFYDLLDTNCTTNTKKSLEAFYYSQWSESGQRCVFIPDHLRGHIHNAAESVAAGFCKPRQRTSD